jgi:hypothetical protein
MDDTSQLDASFSFLIRGEGARGAGLIQTQVLKSGLGLSARREAGTRAVHKSSH